MIKSAIKFITFLGVLSLFSIPTIAKDFYKGKRLTLVASGGAGGGYDNYTRLLSRHLPKYIPGNPRARVQNLNAAGGMVLANYTYNKAKKDGTYIANIRTSVLLEEMFGNKAVKFDGRKFQYIGNLNEDTDSCLVWHKTGATSIKDFYTREFITSGNSRASMSFSFPAAYNYILGTKFKIILGYRGTPARILAMERGEIEATCGLTTTTIKARLPQVLKSGKIRVLAIAGNDPDKDFKGTPNMLDQAKNPEDRAALKFLFSQMQIARIFAVPPGTPKSRVAILRKAFIAGLSSEAFKKDAKRTRTDAVWSDGFKVTKIVNDMYASDPTVVARLREALTAKASKRKLVYRTVNIKILKTKRKGGRIYFKDGGKKVLAYVSGKRTKVKIGGKKSKKSKIKKGMSCAVKYAGSYTKAKSVTCK